VIAVATIALLPQSLAKRSPESRVDDVMAIASDIRRVKQPGNAVLFLPAARRDTKSVSPASFTGLRDIALRETPEESGTLKGFEAGPERIRAAMLGHRRILLVTDAAAVARPATAARERVKAAVLREYFRPVYDEEVRGRRLTVYERLERRPSPGPVGITAR
jgi:mannosyltransferase